MSNNKQSMKLYTEEQVREAIKMARSSYNIFTTSVTFMYAQYEILANLTPIELPSNEEIEERIGFEYPATYQNAFKEGAKWMRDKIQGGNNDNKS
jgi:hypothetical protein